jgi:hypothetical protein
VAERNRQGNWDESGSDRSLKPLIDEYLASTREPVGSRNLFRETPDQSEQAEPRAGAGGRDEAAPAEPAAITLYLVCVAVLLIAALAVGFL